MEMLSPITPILPCPSPSYRPAYIKHQWETVSTLITKMNAVENKNKNEKICIPKLQHYGESLSVFGNGVFVEGPGIFRHTPPS